MTLLTPQEVAQQLGVRFRYVRDNLAKRSDFPRPYRFGMQMRWDKDDIERWVKSCRQ